MRNSRARITLTLSYTAFLLLAGGAVLAGVYVVVRFLPGYPLVSDDPSRIPVATSRGEILDTLVELSLWIMLGFLLIGLLGGWVLAGRVLRPLRALESGARRITAGDLDHRIGLERRDEFGDVARAFDTMVERLQSTLAAQRRFAANASHELRTPLSTMSVLLESAAEHPEDTDPATLVHDLTTENTRAITLMEALLRLHAAGGRDASADDVVDLARLARDTTDRWGVADPATDPAADLAAEPEHPALVIADPLLLRQLVENLVGNAIQHGSGGVRVSTAHRAPGSDGAPGEVVLTVTNRGPVIDEATRARLTEPLFRGAGRAQHPTEGVGLGLALVEQIVETHGGTLRFASPPEGGLNVTVTLPAAPED